MTNPDLVRNAADALGADVFVLNGIVTRDLADTLMDFHIDPDIQMRKSCILAVSKTIGGDPHAAYIMSDYLRHTYPGSFTSLVCGQCWSAGTLLVLGARPIVMGMRGQLGPLDIQLRKKDERIDMESGLDMISALDILTTMAIDTFEEHVLNIEIHTGVSTRLAAEITTKLVATVVSPIAKRLDPIGLGGRQRALGIVREYGKRLGVADKPLEDLITSYPDHGFVITFDEVRSLLGDIVRRPHGHEMELYVALQMMPPAEGLTFVNPQPKDAVQNAKEK